MCSYSVDHDRVGLTKGECVKQLLARWKRWREQSNQNRLTSYENLIRRELVNKQERKSAIHFFCDHEDVEVSVKALLKRFTFSDDNSIVDTTEKEKALDGIISKKDAAIPWIIAHLYESHYIAWPLKALHALTDENTVVQTLEKCLDLEDTTFSQSKIEKNYDVLCHLLDYSHLPDVKSVTHFVSSHDERLRFTAVELLAKFPNPPLSALEQFLYDESPDNTRVRALTFELYSAHGWKIKDIDRCKNIEMSDYHVTSQGTITQTKR